MALSRRIATLVLVVALTAAFAASPAATAPARDSLVVASYGEPTTLDVRFHTGRIGFMVMAPMYENLFRHNAKGEVVGHLAESWNWDDPRSLRVRLRRNVVFHDGQTMTARDVKYSLESMANPDLRSRQQTYLNDIERVDVVNDNEIIIKTFRPTRALIRFLTYYGQIVPARAKVPNPEGIDLAKTPVGTGPYRFVEYLPGNRMVYERFDRYWGQPARTKELVFQIIREPGTRVAALESGDVDVLLGVPAESRDFLRKKGFKIDVHQTVGIYALTVETTKPPFNDLKVRYAALSAIDKQAVAKLHAPESEASQSVLGPGVWARNLMQPFPYNPQRARQLLKEAGAENTEIWYVFDPSNTDGATTIPEAIGEYLRQAGFRVRMQAMERGTFNAHVYTLDPEELFRREFSSTRGAIWVNHKNVLLDKLIDQALGELDTKKASALYRQAQEIIWRDAYWMPLYNIVDAIGYKPSVTGIIEWPGGGLYWLDRAGLQ